MAKVERTRSTAAGSVLRGETALPALLDRVRSTFAMSGVTLLERRAEHPEDHWEVVASAGVGCHHPDDADVVVAAGEGLALVLRGRLLRAEDERVLTVFAVQAATTTSASSGWWQPTPAEATTSQ